MGEDEALYHLKNVLAESNPDLDWANFWSKYQLSVEAKHAAIRVEMGWVKVRTRTPRRMRVLTRGIL